jgi:hypothetical protein
MTERAGPLFKRQFQQRNRLESTMSTREDLQQAFLACRRIHGIKAAMAIVAKFTANNETDLDGIPSAKWDDAIAALTKDTGVVLASGEGDGEATASAPAAPKKTINDLDTMAIYGRWNSKTRAPRPEGQ